MENFNPLQKSTSLIILLSQITTHTPMVTSLLFSSEKAALHIEAVKYYFMELVCKG